MTLKICSLKNYTSEKGTLNKIANRDHIIISKAGKGGATAIRDTDSRIQETTRQIEDTSFYKKLITNPTLEYNTKINPVIDNFNKTNLITEKTTNSLKLENPKTKSFSQNWKFINKESWETCC